MVNVIVVGGGWSGCSAAISAARAGGDVTLLERTDMLLGTGLVGGIFRNNGRFTAAEEAIEMGGGGILFTIMDLKARHRNIEFLGHKHASLYDTAKVEAPVRRALAESQVDVCMESRVVDVKMTGNRLTGVILGDGEEVNGDVFVDCTGSYGPPGNCAKYGRGCAMCILRCQTFGPRVSVTAKAGVKEIMGLGGVGQFGAMSGSCEIRKDSLAPEIVQKLEEKGAMVIPMPREFIEEEKLGVKACVQYAHKEFAENIILLDTGHAKLMTPYFPLQALRMVPGFENARFMDPYAGGRGNSMRFLAMVRRNDALKAEGKENLFCAGEKAGLHVGHTEAIVTGMLAGHNAVRYALGKECHVLPRSTAIGDYIAYVRERMDTKEGLKSRYTFSGGLYFDRMKVIGLYSVDVKEIKDRVAKAGDTAIFDMRLV